MVSEYLLYKSFMRKTNTLPRSPRVSGTVRKKEIIASAASLFAEKGFSGTKTREIAAKAGVSEALIFKHFPSKEDLYAAILAKESPVPALLNRVKGLAKARKDVEVFRVIANTIVGGAPDEELMRLIFFSALEGHELSDMFFRNHIRVFYDFLSGYIRGRIEEGAFRDVPPIIAARSFMGMLIYHRLLGVLFRAKLPYSTEELSEAFVALMLNGLQVPPAPPPSTDQPNESFRKKRNRR